MTDGVPPLFSDPKADAIGTVCALVTVIFASAGGIGGGGVSLPLRVALPRTFSPQHVLLI